MQFAVKANDWTKDVVIHKYPCPYIRIRGGEPGKYGQVHWEDFNDLQAAENYAQIWEMKGYRKKYCSRCIGKSD